MTLSLLFLALIFTPVQANLKDYKPEFNYYYGIKKEPEIAKAVEIAKPKNQPKTILKQDQESYLIDTDLELSKDEIIDLIKFYSEKYKVDPDQSLRIAKCESGFNANALSKGGKYKGLYQWDNSFYGYAKILEIEKPNVFNPEHNIRAATLAMSYGLWSKWSCK